MLSGPGPWATWRKLWRRVPRRAPSSVWGGTAEATDSGHASGRYSPLKLLGGVEVTRKMGNGPIDSERFLGALKELKGRPTHKVFTAADRALVRQVI